MYLFKYKVIKFIIIVYKPKVSNTVDNRFHIVNELNRFFLMRS